MEESKEKHLTGFWKRALGLLEITIAVLVIVGMVEQWSFGEWVIVDIILILSGIIFSIVHFNLVLGALSVLIFFGLLLHFTYYFWILIDVVAIVVYGVSGVYALAGRCLTEELVGKYREHRRDTDQLRQEAKIAKKALKIARGDEPLAKMVELLLRAEKEPLPPEAHAGEEIAYETEGVPLPAEVPTTEEFLPELTPPTPEAFEEIPRKDIPEEFRDVTPADLGPSGERGVERQTEISERPEPPADTFPEERGVDDSSIWGT